MLLESYFLCQLLVFKKTWILIRKDAGLMIMFFFRRSGSPLISWPTNLGIRAVVISTDNLQSVEKING